VIFFTKSEQAQAQHAIRSAMPARPNINLPQNQNARHAQAPQANSAFSTNLPGNSGFDNSGFSSRSNRGFNDFGFNPWNSWGYGDWSAWNAWNGFATPSWNTFLSINPINPAMNWYWSAPAWPMWNANPYWMNAHLNPMLNGFNMNPAWNNMNPFWNPYIGFQNGLAVGPWNGFNPAMLMNNPAWSGISQ
jgi:hypothetical protein